METATYLGTDIAGVPRPQGPAYSVGAYEYDVGYVPPPQDAGVELDRNGYPESSEDHLLIAWTHEALTGQRIQLPLSLDDETRD